MIDKPVIVSVETATRRGSVCLTQGDELLASAVGNPEDSHSNTLLREINWVLERSELSLSDVHLLAAALGPGSFTGLRIGLATIKALAVTLARPCIGVPTLQAVACAGGPSKVTVSLLPAGRGELFAQMLSVTSQETVVELDEPAHVSPVELLQRYRNQPHIRWCGEGAHTRRGEIRDWANNLGISFSEIGSDSVSTSQEGWSLAPPELILARHVAVLALNKFERGDAGDPNSLRALYVRPSDAELKSNVNNAGRG